MAGSENEAANSSSGEEEELSSEGSLSESDPDKASSTPSAGKRPASAAEDDVDDGGELKRIKKMTVVAVAAPDADNCYGEKKQQPQQQLFQRLWSEENEIELIEGMINYVNEKGKDPLADVNDFHEFVKKTLHVDVNDRQVLTKARRLKKKFENNVARVESKGKVRSFSNPHEKKMYDLSKNLWGNDSNNKNVVTSKKLKVKVNVTPKTNKSVGSGNGNVNVVNVNEVVAAKVARFGSLGLPITDEGIINKGLELVSGAEKVEMEAKWKNLKVQELEHFLKKMEVLKEQAEVVLNAIAKSVELDNFPSKSDRNVTGTCKHAMNDAHDAFNGQDIRMSEAMANCLQEVVWLPVVKRPQGAHVQPRAALSPRVKASFSFAQMPEATFWLEIA
ncbi:hypothetical protein QVD17_17912 [Tagetes erecta]|uniref:Uncharacterized protein n=1 Tax=Tagetes erecta TaxID=13708 RepID=A0AAD8NVR0_TARER|nr:hypothetical protein QVD17_17912 [Tagetes erecta]